MTARTNARWICIVFAALCAPVCANDWLTMSDYYVGAWKNNNRLQGFEYAEWVSFELWQGTDGLPAGVAVFSKGKKRCIGKLSALQPEVQGGRWRLRFDPIASPDCEGIVGGHFVTSRSRTNHVVTLVFVPDGTAYSGQVIMTNTATFFKLEETPSELEPVVKLARGDSDGLERKLSEEKIAQEEVIASLRDTLSDTFRSGFPEADLIGTWRGVIVDRRTQHPAEIAFWSGTRYPLHQIFGAIRFADDRICTAALQVRSAPGVASVDLGSHRIRKTQGDREDVGGKGQLLLSDDGTSLALRFHDLGTRSKRLSNEYCIPELGTPDSGRPCQIAGVFVRSAPSAELKESLASIEWHHDSPGPSDGYWDMLSFGDTGLASLRALHEDGLEHNRAVFAEMDRANQERLRRERDELLAESRAEAAEKLRRTMRPTTSAPASALGAAESEPLPPLPELPVVRGPFDEIRGGAFLNALHNGDHAAISRFDEYYQQRKIRQMRSFLGEHALSGLYEAATRQVRLADTVLAVYLFNYQSAFGACLGDDAAVFEVVEEVPDIVVENLLGIEVMRFYGWTNRKEFKVKPEFASAFRRVGAMKPDGGMSTVSDFLLNGGGTDLRRELLAGTREFMRRFDCNSEEIRRLEKTLLEFSSR